MDDMFEKASRMRLRFDSPKGQLTIEDLWEIPLTSERDNVANLDSIAINIHRQLKNDEDMSYVIKGRKSDPVVQLKFDLVRHIIDVRLTDQEAVARAQDNANKRQRILSIIADKEDEQLKAMSPDELREIANNLRDIGKHMGV